MDLKIFYNLFKPNKSNLLRFVSNNTNMNLIKENGVKYVRISKRISTDDISKLLDLLWEEKYEFSFHDSVHSKINDSEVYYSYSTLKSLDNQRWSMSYGSQGWSEGVYQIYAFIIARQLISLIKKEELSRIQISNNVFLSNNNFKSDDECKKMESEIQKMHRKMTTIEIVNKISSKDSHQIWESACEIVSLGQDREAIKPLIPLASQINKLTKDIEMGGAFAPNSRFISAAIKTLEFHRDSKECTCQLFGIHDGMDPNDEVNKGYLKIDNTNKIEGDWLDNYDATCTRCHQKFRIDVRLGHYMWFSWNRIK
jgi:hypothetical protein